MLRLGLPDVKINGIGASRSVAAVAHSSEGLVSLVWATGDIVANSGFVGGLVRSMATGSQIRESWFVGKVRGSSSTGGLVGYGAAGSVGDSWAVARVEWSGTGDRIIGGLVGASEGAFSLINSWSGGRLDAGAHALIAGSGSFNNQNYFDSSISPAGIPVTRAQFVVDTMVTVTNSDWQPAAWNFGETTDYPVLQGIDDLWPGLQAVVFADFQSEILVITTFVKDADPVTGEESKTLTLSTGGTTPLEIGDSITLSLGDTNGLAPDGGATPTRTCEAGSSYAELNHNDVTVQLQTSEGGSATFTDDCKIKIAFADDLSRGRFSVSVLIASQEAAIERWSHLFEAPSLFRPLPVMDIVVPADAPKGYAFLTVTLHTGELVRDAAGRTPIFGHTGEIYSHVVVEQTTTVSGVEVVATSTITTARAQPRRAMVDAIENNLVAVFYVVGWRRDGIVCERR